MKGVSIHIKTNKKNEIRLIINDIASTSTSDTPDWKYNALFTNNDYDAKAFKEMSLSTEQYAEIGENIILRLLALNNLLK